MQKQPKPKDPKPNPRQENPKIKDNYEVKYNLEATSDALSTDVMKENLDMAIVPSNMAATAYNKTSNYQSNLMKLKPI